MISNNKAKIISNFIYYIDSICRNDFHIDNIVNERDYVSNFSCHIRYPNGIIKRKALIQPLIFCSTSNAFIEQKYGIDSIIIFKKDNKCKIGGFESKVLKKDFDSINKPKYKPRISRFTSQLERQKLIWNSIVVWEMFFNKEKLGSSNFNLDKYGSTCIMHSDCINYYKNNINNQSVQWKLKDIHGQSSSFKNIKDIIFQMLICELGEKHNVSDNFIKLKEMEENIPFSGSKEILDFLKKTGIKNYLLYNINE
jgi:hypothetical protein